MKRTWRRVVSYKIVIPSIYRKPKVELTLECGHKDWRGLSQPAPKRVICIACEIESIRR